MTPATVIPTTLTATAISETPAAWRTATPSFVDIASVTVNTLANGES